MPESSEQRAYIERCQREAEVCRLAGSAPGITDTQRLGAIQGEMDWLVAQQIAEEEAGLCGAG